MAGAARGWTWRLADGGRGLADGVARLADGHGGSRGRDGGRGSRVDIGGSRMADAARGWRTRLADGMRGSRMRARLADGGRGSRVKIGGSRIHTSTSTTASPTMKPFRLPMTRAAPVNAGSSRTQESGTATTRIPAEIAARTPEGSVLDDEAGLGGNPQLGRRDDEGVGRRLRVTNGGIIRAHNHRHGRAYRAVTPELLGEGGGGRAGRDGHRRP